MSRIEKILGFPSKGYSGFTIWETTANYQDIRVVFVGGNTVQYRDKQALICYLESEYSEIKLEVWDDAPIFNELKLIVDNKDVYSFIELCMNQLSSTNILDMLESAYKDGIKFGKSERSREFAKLLSDEDD